MGMDASTPLPRLTHMYEPILISLVDGLRGYGDWDVQARVIPLRMSTTLATCAHKREVHALLLTELAPLKMGDLFVWIGSHCEVAVPFEMLRERGVTTVYYQTEPQRTCRYVSASRYSEARTCMLHEHVAANPKRFLCLHGFRLQCLCTRCPRHD